MKLIFMGTPQFAASILETLLKHHEILMVVTQPDKPVGRKKILKPSEVKTLALAHGLNLFQPVKLLNEYEKLLTLDADLIITAAYGQMLPKGLLNHFKAINVHGSILPEYRGGAPIQYALFDGKAQTGVSIMWMAQKMDSGDVIKYAYTDIDRDDNFETLAEKLSIIGAQTLIEVLDTYESQNYHIEATPQEHEKATFAYNIKRIEEFVDFREKTEYIINRLRGLLPHIGISFKLGDSVLKAFELKPVSDIIEHMTPGEIYINKGLFIKTVDGTLEVVQIQAPGKKVMATKDYLNGQQLIKSGAIVARKDTIDV